MRWRSDGEDVIFSKKVRARVDKDVRVLDALNGSGELRSCRSAM